MFDAFQMTLLVVVLLGLVLFGTHIAVALGLTAALGVYLMMGDIEVLTNFLANTAYEAIRDYIFAVIPLFILMGEFLARCGAARDLFALVNRVMRWLPGRLGVATVVANALFAFVTGVSIAAAAAFSRIAYPEMKRHGYQRRFALATIASSSCLGMLIPPSVLMIVWGVITEESIGSLFLAGVIPGLIVVGAFSFYIILVAILNPSVVGEAKARALSAAVPVVEEEEGAEPSVLSALLSTGLIICLIVGVLGGIWAGFFTPTEGAGVGAAGALVIGIMKGLRLKDISEVVLTVGRTTAPLLLLLVMAQIYSRVLSMTGVTGAVQTFFLDTGLPPMAIIGLMILIWFLLGCVIDSISIILLTVPVFAPIASALGFDPLAFAIIGIIAVETGLLTPPFGILVFTVKASLPHERVPVGEIFAGCIPFWIILLGTVVLLVLVPETATWLPNLGR
jgi:tripartite ATP-independent transporter DctM subunit